jgi:NTE family protein
MRRGRLASATRASGIAAGSAGWCVVCFFVIAAMTAMPAGAGCPPGAARGAEPTALVLSGGGAKGAWDAGVARGLVDAGVPIRVVAGSSAGALNAVMLADGRLDRLEALWRTVTRDHVFFLRPAVIFAGLLPGWLTAATLTRSSSLLDPAPLRELIASTLDLDRVRRSAIRALVVTTDLVRREPKVFDNASVTLDALMAATALPGVFPPVTVDGQVLVDGGLVARAPVLEALASGVPVRRAIVAAAYATAERGRAPAGLRAALEEAFETAMVHQIGRDVELARLRHPDVDVQVIVPSAPLDVRPLDFDPDALSRAFERGVADARACVGDGG